MCGILGLVSVDRAASSYFDLFDAALNTIKHRGPDNISKLMEQNIALGHTRLSIIDLDERSNQPMTDLSGRFTIIFNGEIYNYQELRNECEEAGYSFRTMSDTEVLQVMFMRMGKKCLDKLNGFFSLGIYDREEKSLFVARDRMGIKPLVYYANDETFAFGSELRALMALGFPKVLDKVSLFNYFKLNYIPAPATILKDHYKLEPGHSILVSWKNDAITLEKEQWYSIPYDPDSEKELSHHDYKQSQKVLKRFVRESIRRRLVADVEVGTFLSGGIDSSIITAIAKEEKNDITAFSIGFPDQPYYDESSYAKEVAGHLGANHHVFNIKFQDLLESSDEILNHLDEPFADSSALNVNVLSKSVRQHVKVALSGDGGDELFGGYHKHGAEFRVRNAGIKEHMVGKLHLIWGQLPASRSGRLPNFIRQLQKFSDGYNLKPKDRYWRWAGVMNEEQVNYLIKEEMLQREQRLSDEGHLYKKRKDNLLRSITKGGSLNQVLLTDAQLVLPNDMLYKVDQMSMMQALEVRTPMLDHHIVKFAFRLPEMFKVNHTVKKKILQDSFSDILPASVFNRQKKGFEVPLMDWFKGEYKSHFLSFVNDKEFLMEQGLFNFTAIKEMSDKLYSNNPGDTASWAWSFLVFQTWYKRYMI